MRYNFLLFSKFIGINGLFLSFIIVCLLNGWIQQILLDDITFISLGILIVTILTILYSGYRCYWITNNLDNIDNINIDKDLLELRLYNKIQFISFVGRSLPQIGFIGTVIGFMIAFSGISDQDLSNVDSIPSMIGTAFAGMFVALYTTLTGLVCGRWVMLNYQLLATGMVQLLTKVKK